MLGNDVYYEFGNTTDVVTPTASGHAKPNYAHFKKVISRMGRFDLVLFCGNQAHQTAERFADELKNVRCLNVPHPAARNLSNAKIDEIREKVQSILNK